MSAVRELEIYLTAARESIEAALAEVLDDYLSGVAESLTAPIRYACEGGGKRFRPTLFLASYEVGGRRAGRRVARLATALEIVHSYSLVHDDLPCMDDDDWRRGRLTCHRRFGVERATLAAAAMVPLASQVLAGEAAALELGAADRAGLVVELSSAAGPAGMVGGQVLDLIYEGRLASGGELGEIHRRKTGALIRASARLGGLTARLAPELLAALTEYGEAVGLAFQIADDLLDEEGAEARGARSDRQMGKATYPVVYGSEEARTRARELADSAIAALREARIESPVLEGLAIHVVERES
jgi:geranylgeranyl diphosphate synthase type II